MDNWEQAVGVVCSKCGQEAFQVVAGVCTRCHKAKIGQSEDKLADIMERRYYQDKLRQGTISMEQLRNLEG